MTVPFETQWLGGLPGYAADRLRLFGMADVMKSPSDAFGPLEGIVQGGIPTIAGNTWTLPQSVLRLRNSAAGQGAYTYILEASRSGTIAAQPASGSRIDLLYAACGPDPNADDGVLAVATGVPAASPNPPNLPIGALLLGTIRVPTTGNGSPSMTASRRYTAAPGAVLPWDASRGGLPPLRPGQIFKQLDQVDNTEWMTQDDTHGDIPLYDSIGRDWALFACSQNFAPNSSPSWGNISFNRTIVSSPGTAVYLNSGGSPAWTQAGLYRMVITGYLSGGAGGSLPGSECALQGLVNGVLGTATDVMSYPYSPFFGNVPVDYIGKWYSGGPGFMLARVAQNTGATRTLNASCWVVRVGP